MLAISKSRIDMLYRVKYAFSFCSENCFSKWTLSNIPRNRVANAYNIYRVIIDKHSQLLAYL